MKLKMKSLRDGRFSRHEITDRQARVYAYEKVAELIHEYLENDFDQDTIHFIDCDVMLVKDKLTRIKWNNIKRALMLDLKLFKCPGNAKRNKKK